MSMKLKWSKYIPIEPLPKQVAFLTLPHKEVLFGGAAGGGKSEALLAAALQYVDVPGYSAIIFRRTLTDLKLPNSLLSRAKRWLGPYVAKKEISYVPGEHAFYFPSGAVIAFGYLDAQLDHQRYQSAEFQFIGMDEATQFREDDYLYLFSRLRRTKNMSVPLRFRAATNPGGTSHQFIKDRFSIRRNNETGLFQGYRKNRPFIPSFVSDNTYLDQEYRENLKELGALERSRLLEGNWDSQAAAIYAPSWFDRRYTIKNQRYIVLHSMDGVKVLDIGNMIRFCCIDSASSERTGIEGKSFRENRPPAWSVCGTFALNPKPPFELIWLHNTRSQCKIPEFQDKVKIIYRKWKPQFLRLQDTTADRGLGQNLEAEGLPIKWAKDIIDKVANSISSQIRAERGGIWLPKEAFWLKDLENELYSWTGSPKDVDDQVDVLSSAGQEAALFGLGEERDDTLETPIVFSGPRATGGVPKYLL